MRTRVVLLAIPLLLLTDGSTVAENINPESDGSKYAWAENLGWFNAQPGGPGGPGVHVSDSSLTGWMWSENAGWIDFSSAGPNPYQVATAWRAATPGGASVLTAGTTGGTDALLTWTALSGATEYDVVYGDLNALGASGGSFQTATLGQVVCHASGTSATGSGDPGVGHGFWYLVRDRSYGGVGTYDSGDAAQVGLRDAEIAASGQDCPN